LIGFGSVIVLGLIVPAVADAKIAYAMASHYILLDVLIYYSLAKAVCHDPGTLYDIVNHSFKL